MINAVLSSKVQLRVVWIVCRHTKRWTNWQGWSYLSEEEIEEKGCKKACKGVDKTKDASSRGPDVYVDGVPQKLGSAKPDESKPKRKKSKKKKSKKKKKKKSKKKKSKKKTTKNELWMPTICTGYSKVYAAAERYGVSHCAFRRTWWNNYTHKIHWTIVVIYESVICHSRISFFRIFKFHKSRSPAQQRWENFPPPTPMPQNYIRLTTFGFFQKCPSLRTRRSSSGFGSPTLTYRLVYYLYLL